MVRCKDDIYNPVIQPIIVNADKRPGVQLKQVSKDVESDNCGVKPFWGRRSFEEKFPRFL